MKDLRQCITMVELTEEEAQVFKDCPVVVDFGKSGFYVFPVSIG
jgi:sarcosine oxidase/L-pipecolate oxidase